MPRVCVDVSIQIDDDVVARRRFYARSKRNGRARVFSRDKAYRAVFDALTDPKQATLPRLQPDGDSGWVVTVPACASMPFRGASELVSRGSAVLAPGEWLVVACAGYRFRFECSVAERPLRRKLWPIPGLRWPLVSAVGHAALLALIMLWPPDTKSIERTELDDLAPRVLTQDVKQSIPLPEVRGALFPWKARRVIWNNLGPIKRCYERELKRASPTVGGRMTVLLRIEDSGRVSHTGIVENATNAHLALCVQDKLRRVKFPRPLRRGSTLVTYPFVFRPS